MCTIFKNFLLKFKAHLRKNKNKIEQHLTTIFKIIKMF